MFYLKKHTFLAITAVFLLAGVVNAGFERIPEGMTAGEFEVARQQLIEQGYQTRLRTLKHQAQLKVQRLTTAERALWVEFMRMKGAKIGPQEYFRDILLYAGELPFNITEDAFFRQDLIQEYFRQEAAQMLLDKQAYRRILSIIEDPKIRKDSPLWKKAFRVQQLMQPFQLKLNAIETRRAYQLAKLAELIEQHDSEPVHIMTEPVADEQSELVVSAISFGDEPSAMIADKLIRQGDTINDLKVTKIYQNSVAFESESASWTQEIGQLPPEKTASK